jgi:hypothetical protein
MRPLDVRTRSTVARRVVAVLRDREGSRARRGRIFGSPDCSRSTSDQAHLASKVAVKGQAAESAGQLKSGLTKEQIRSFRTEFFFDTIQ